MPASNFKDFTAGSVLAANADMDALQTWIRQNFIAKDTGSEPLDNNSYVKAKNASGTSYNTVGIDGDNVMQIGDASLVSKLNGIPAVFAYHGANQVIASNTYYTLSLNNEAYDTSPGGTMHDTVTNNSRLVPPVTGKYLVVAVGKWTPTAVGDLQITIRRDNGDGTGTYFGTSRLYAGTANKEYILTTAAIVSLTTSQYVTMIAYQTTGVSQDLQASNESPNFFMVRVG